MDKNVIDEYPQPSEKLKKLMYKNWQVEEVIENCKLKMQNHQILSRWGQNVDYEEKERWPIPSRLKNIKEENFI